jgi:hypothetical protein
MDTKNYQNPPTKKIYSILEENSRKYSNSNTKSENSEETEIFFLERGRVTLYLV